MKEDTIKKRAGRPVTPKMTMISEQDMVKVAMFDDSQLRKLISFLITYVPREKMYQVREYINLLS